MGGKKGETDGSDVKRTGEIGESINAYSAAWAGKKARAVGFDRVFLWCMSLSVEAEGWSGL